MIRFTTLVAILSYSAAAAADRPVERRLPDEEKLTEKIVEATLRSMRTFHQKHGGPMQREVHGRGHGCLRGTFTVLPDRDPRTRVGLFAAPGSYPVWARLSSGANAFTKDTTINVRGIAVKVMGVAGPRLLESDHDGKNQDFLLNTPPFHPSANARQYLDSKRVQRSTTAFGLYLLKHPHFAARFVRAGIGGRKVSNPLRASYFSGGPFSHGQTAVKHRLSPCDGKVSPPRLTGKAHLERAARRQLARGEACFLFSLQFFQDEESTPIEDFSVEWRTRWYPVARLVFPRQEIDSPARQAFCRDLSFSPFRGLAAHRPMGSLNRIRKAVYEASDRLRHEVNRAPRREPTGAEEL